MQKKLVRLRRFPYPYKAALTICSDIDGTKTRQQFLAIQEFLNSRHYTTMGPGLGLEIGNSFFPYTPDDSFAYFSSRPEDRKIIEEFIKASYIDCLHSYGDGVCSRADALRALEEFERSGCKLDVWVDHAMAPSNFGKDVTSGLGDVEGSPVYHADATLAHGIRFIWKGRCSSILGHGVPFSPWSFTRVFDKNYPFRSANNIFKEFCKTALAYAGNRRFAIHRHNQLLRVDCLQDGQQIFEFKRCNNHWLGLSHGHDCTGLVYVIRRKALENLIASQGYAVIYTHLGVGSGAHSAIPDNTQAALRGLSQSYRDGDIYITTTSRLISYYLNYCYLNWSYSISDEGWTRIFIYDLADPIFGPRQPSLEELQGVTFYVPDSHKVQVYLRDRLLDAIECNPPDFSGEESVMIPRTFLDYPF